MAIWVYAEWSYIFTVGLKINDLIKRLTKSNNKSSIYFGNRA